MGVFPFVHPSRRWLHADVRNGVVKRVHGIAVRGRRVLWSVVVCRSTCSPLRLRCSMVGVLSSMCELSLPCKMNTTSTTTTTSSTTSTRPSTTSISTVTIIIIIGRAAIFGLLIRRTPLTFAIISLGVAAHLCCSFAFWTLRVTLRRPLLQLPLSQVSVTHIFTCPIADGIIPRSLT